MQTELGDRVEKHHKLQNVGYNVKIKNDEESMMMKPQKLLERHHISVRMFQATAKE